MTRETTAEELGKGTLADVAFAVVRPFEGGKSRLGGLGAGEKETRGGGGALLRSTDQITVALLKADEKGRVLRLETGKTNATTHKLLVE
jgi:hypothetical protein